MTPRRSLRTAAVTAAFGMAASVLAPVPALRPTLAKDLTVETQPRSVHLVDRRLVTAQGVEVNFVSDLIAKQPILLSFTFTGCVQLCPPSDVIMDVVAQRMEKDGLQRLKLVTLTLDPLTDTPEHLRRERADQMHRDRIFLSGDPTNVWSVLEGLRVQPGPNQDHDIQFLLIGTGGRDVRTVAGLPEPEDLIAALSSLQ
ncbi:SCO family protein [Nitrobacter sp. TKz-YC01]|uniref:SCO family protein n=1 Tax=Nitrobacter sp. TKz-YC01 TaxID=3398703 RepID=UPI003A0FE82F